MKIPKQFIYFLAIAQVILILGHWALFVSLVFFFPGLQQHRHSLMLILALLSISFLSLSVAEFKSENSLLRLGYIVSSVLLVAWLYLMIAAAISAVFFLLAGKNIMPLTSSIFAGAFFLSLYGVINARVTRVVSLKIKLPNLPEYWKGKTAVLVSDLHLGHVLRRGFAEKIINKINELSPEIVFIPGDFYDGVKTNFAALAALFKKVNSPLGIYFCSGNHEIFAGYGQCEAALREAGIKILENQTEDIHGLQVAGAAYNHDVIPNFREVLSFLNLDRTKPSILLKHVPLQLKEAAEAGVSLQLSGHSHQGQVWPFRYVTQRIFKDFDYGFKKLGAMQIYTSSGVGTWGPPMRVFTKSEIIKITFE